MERYILHNSSKKIVGALVMLRPIRAGRLWITHETGGEAKALIIQEGGREDSTVETGGGGCRTAGGGGIPH